MSLKILGSLATGQAVYDRPNSHVHGSVIQALPLVFARLSEEVTSAGQRLLWSDQAGTKIQFDGIHKIAMPIAEFRTDDWVTSCVPTGDGDRIMYAQRPRRHGPTRFVVGRDTEPTEWVTVILKPTEEGWLVITAFFGPISEKEPWDRNISSPDEYLRCVEFWRKHALVMGTEQFEGWAQEKDFWFNPAFS